MQAVGVYPSLPSRDLRFGEVTVELPDEVYAEYVVAVGRRARKIYQDIVTGNSYKQMKDDNKRLLLNRTINRIRDQERRKLRVKVLRSLRTGENLSFR